MPRRVARLTDAAFRELADAQDGVLSREQLARLGWNHDHIEDAVAAERWAAYGKHAVVLHRGPLTTRQVRWIALLNTGPNATLVGLTAAEELGLVGFGTPTVHVVVGRNDWVPRAQPGVKVHISRRFTLADRHPGRRIPTVRFPRGLVDGASWTPTARRACAIVIAGIQQRLTRVDRVRSEILAAGRIRHRKVLLAVLHDVEGGVHALSELDFALLCRRYRLPAPERQQRRRDALGRTRYLDVRFRCANGRALNVEIDGSAHFDIVAAWADMRRDLALLVQGEVTVRIPSTVIRTDPADVAAQIRSLIDTPW